MELANVLSIGTSLITLTLLEIVLGIDNIVFISILCGRLPKNRQKLARRVGLLFALFARLALLAGIVWIIKLNKPIFQIMSNDFSVRDIFMILGGFFLLAKGTWEIHAEIEEELRDSAKPKRHASFFGVIVQIILFDIIFSLDSILTAVGLTELVWIMAVAIVIAVFIMLVASEPLSRFIERYASLKMLALSFLILIGMTLVADGFGAEIPKGYIYSSIAFSLLVEMLNIQRSKKKASADKIN